VQVVLEPVFNAGVPVVSMVRAPDDRLYFCTLKGKELIHAGGATSVFLDLASIADVPFHSGGANGLYGLPFHPGFNDPASRGYRLCYTYHDERKFVSGSGGPLTGLPEFWSPEQYVPDALADPKLTNISGQTPILSNDDWGDSPEAAYTKSVSASVFSFGLPEGSKDAALVVTLPPGTYTMHASSGDGVSTGVALVEVYEFE